MPAISAPPKGPASLLEPALATSNAVATPVVVEPAIEAKSTVLTEVPPNGASVNVLVNGDKTAEKPESRYKRVSCCWLSGLNTHQLPSRVVENAEDNNYDGDSDNDDSEANILCQCRMIAGDCSA